MKQIKIAKFIISNHFVLYKIMDDHIYLIFKIIKAWVYNNCEVKMLVMSFSTVYSPFIAYKKT